MRVRAFKHLMFHLSGLSDSCRKNTKTFENQTLKTKKSWQQRRKQPKKPERSRQRRLRGRREKPQKEGADDENPPENPAFVRRPRRDERLLGAEKSREARPQGGGAVSGVGADVSAPDRHGSHRPGLRRHCRRAFVGNIAIRQHLCGHRSWNRHG